MRGADMTDEEFLRDRLAMVRDLAGKADPHIKRRLVLLAEVYDRRLKTMAANTSSHHPVQNSRAG